MPFHCLSRIDSSRRKAKAKHTIDIIFKKPSDMQDEEERLGAHIYKPMKVQKLE